MLCVLVRHWSSGPLGANARDRDRRGVAKYSNSVTAAVTCDNAERGGYRPGVTGDTGVARTYIILIIIRRGEPTRRVGTYTRIVSHDAAV